MTVHKPHAPIAATFADVGVSILRSRRPMVEALSGLGGTWGMCAKHSIGRSRCFDRDEVRLLARSSHYRTAPWGFANQPPSSIFASPSIPGLTPHHLLARAQAVERALGRERAKEERWGPRPVDIDLLAYDDLALQAPDLTLPHPRLFARAFVLAPLAEIAPERVIAGVRVREALAQLDASGIERLAPAENQG